MTNYLQEVIYKLQTRLNTDNITKWKILQYLKEYNIQHWHISFEPYKVDLMDREVYSFDHKIWEELYNLICK